MECLSVHYVGTPFLPVSRYVAMSVHSFWFFRSSVVCGECAVKDFRECGDNKDIVSTGFSMIETGFIFSDLHGVVNAGRRHE